MNDIQYMTCGAQGGLVFLMIVVLRATFDLLVVRDGFMGFLGTGNLFPTADNHQP